MKQAVPHFLRSIGSASDLPGRQLCVSVCVCGSLCYICFAAGEIANKLQHPFLENILLGGLGGGQLDPEGKQVLEQGQIILLSMQL